MELRQIRYFVRVVELGSMSRAALELDMVQSALSQQISRLEGELSTRLLQRTAKGAGSAGKKQSVECRGSHVREMENQVGIREAPWSLRQKGLMPA